MLFSEFIQKDLVISNETHTITAASNYVYERELQVEFLRK